jgi:phage gpG-like protein
VVTAEDYVRELIRRVPGIVKDAMDPQLIQAELAVDISDNMGELNRNPVYPRAGGKTLQVVTGNLLRAATVYKGKGNVSKTTGSGETFAFQWGIDLKVVPYARIHDLGGEAGRRSKRVTIDARPYITPAMEAFSGGKGTVDASKFTASTTGFARIVNEIYLRLSLV